MKLSYICESRSQWYKPSFKHEKSELIRQARELGLNEQEMFSAFNEGELILLPSSIWEVMDNTESNDPSLTWELVNTWHQKDVANIRNALVNRTPIPAPIVLEYDGAFYCVAGNTRLCICKLMHVTPAVWFLRIGQRE